MVERTESFVRHWLYNTLGAEWHWYRFEYAVVHVAMHCHGLAKLKDDPGLCDLASKAVLAKQFLEKGKSSPQSNLSVLDSTVINDGVSAVKIICDYYDKSITCIKPADMDSWVKPTVRPCQKKLDEAIISSEDDYANLVNTVQRHSKCSSYYCLRQDQLGNQYCRFHYPFEMNDKTYIQYDKVTSRGESYFRPEVVAKRNDPRVNRHQRIQLQGWRANCDIQLIIDHHACI